MLFKQSRFFAISKIVGKLRELGRFYLNFIFIFDLELSLWIQKDWWDRFSFDFDINLWYLHISLNFDYLKEMAYLEILHLYIVANKIKLWMTISKAGLEENIKGCLLF